jgi:hypothetical protein
MSWIVTPESRAAAHKRLTLALRRGSTRRGKVLGTEEAGRRADVIMSKLPGLYALGEHPDVDLNVVPVEVPPYIPVRETGVGERDACVADNRCAAGGP